MADAEHVPACDFVLNEEQAGMTCAPPRPGRISDEITNTLELIHAFIRNYLPNRKYVKDHIFPKLFSNSRTLLNGSSIRNRYYNTF
jgi:hypothetical protein